jgi:hypothetical protein
MQRSQSSDLGSKHGHMQPLDASGANNAQDLWQLDLHGQQQSSTTITHNRRASLDQHEQPQTRMRGAQKLRRDQATAEAHELAHGGNSCDPQHKAHVRLLSLLPTTASIAGAASGHRLPAAAASRTHDGTAADPECAETEGARWGGAAKDAGLA